MKTIRVIFGSLAGLVTVGLVGLVIYDVTNYNGALTGTPLWMQVLVHLALGAAAYLVLALGYGVARHFILKRA